MKFKVGARVVLVNIDSSWGETYGVSKSNTVGNVGIVTRVDNECSGYYIDWDNGSSNSYTETNLRYMEVVND